MWYTLFIILAIVCAVLLVLVVLAQNSKGGGLSSQLERLTWGFAIAIMVFSLATNFTAPNTSVATDEILERAKEQQAAPGIDIKKAAPSADSTKK